MKAKEKRVNWVFLVSVTHTDHTGQTQSLPHVNSYSLDFLSCPSVLGGGGGQGTAARNVPRGGPPPDPACHAHLVGCSRFSLATVIQDTAVTSGHLPISPPKKIKVLKIINK